MKQKFQKYLKESFRKSSGEQLSFKYILNFADAGEISPKWSGGFSGNRHKLVKRRFAQKDII